MLISTFIEDRSRRNRCVHNAFSSILLLVSLIVSWVSLTSPCCAQALVAGTEPNDPNKPPQPPFLLPAQPTDIGEAMEDFRRFVGRKQWEKAFKHLEKVFASKNDGLVLTADGIMLPSRMIAREALLELPVPGQDAYRLFFDAEAKKMLEAAKDKEELTNLSQIFSRFLVTSVGDTAADRLGDLHFEAGNLEQALHAWRSVLDQRPDTQLPKARLRTKVGVVLARLERWNEFDELLKEFEELHAKEKMTLGGKEVVALEHLRTIAERGKKRQVENAVVSNPGTYADIPLPTEVEPVWQFRFFPDPEPKTGKAQGLVLQNRFWWGGPQQSTDWVPPVVIEGSKLFTNFVGYDLGIDLETGKLLWRSGRIFDAVQKAQQGQITPLEQHGLALTAGRIWSVARSGNNQNQNRWDQSPSFGITSRETETGKQVFTSSQSGELRDWSMRGTPLVDGDRIYVTANKSNQNRDLELLALNAKDAKLIWSTKIGSYTTESNPYMMERTFQPSLALHAGHLYVDSHSGSLVQLDSISGQVEWGLNYVSEVSQQNRFWGWGWDEGSNDPLTVGAPQVVDGVLYLKGMKSVKLYAVDPQRPRVTWHRPVSRVANLIGVDRSRFYLGGDDISAYDLKTRKIVWSVNTRLASGWAKSVMTENRIFHFSPRGIYEIDKAEGQIVRVFRGADRDSLGGTLIITPKVLVSVSNLAITAYPLTTEKKAGDSQSPSAAIEPQAQPIAISQIKNK